jgi:hypothetical protein
MKLKSSILILALLVSSLAVAVPMARAVDPEFQFNPDPVIANVGTEVEIQIRLNTVGSFNAWEATIRWNKNVLKYKGITWGWLSTEDIGDFNDDYVLDSTDLGIMGAAWGAFIGDPNWNPACDLNGDGVIDSTDLGTLGAHWGHFGTPSETELAVLSPIGNELSIYEGFNDPAYENPGSTPFLLATVKFLVLSGGISNLEFLDYEHLWGAGAVLIPCTTNDGYLYTLQPFVDFTMTPANAATFNYKSARPGETITFDGSASSSADGDTITGYAWSIDGLANGTAVTTTGSFATYSKTAHDVALTVSDSGGHSYTLHKPYTVNRDISMFSIWPSMEDYQGSIEFEFVSGKYVVILVRYANIGTITEYTDNAFGDFPATAEVQLYLIHSDGTEEKIDSTYGGRLRRYWNYTQNAAALTRLYDWQPVVGVSRWKFWDLWGASPETDLHFKANFTDTATGNDPFIGDTDLANNELWFGPFDIVAGSDHDIRIEGIYEYDDCGYYTPIAPFGTAYKYYYGGKFLNPVSGVMGPFDPVQPGMQFNLTVDMSNVGAFDETGVVWHVYAGDTEIYTSTDDLDTATGYFSFEFPWDTTLFAGVYTLTVYVEPVSGETGLWATWDNNTPENNAFYGLKYFNAYDDWGVLTAHP